MSDPRESREPSSTPDIGASAEQARTRMRQEFEALRKDILAEPTSFAEPTEPATEADRQQSRFMGRSGATALALLGVMAATALGVVTGQVVRNGSPPISGRLIPYPGEGGDARGGGPWLADNRPAGPGGVSISRAKAVRNEVGAGGEHSSPRLVAAEAPSTPPGPSGGSPLPGGGTNDGAPAPAPAPGPDREAPPSTPPHAPRPERTPPSRPPAAEPRPGDSPGPKPVKPPSTGSGGDSPGPVTAATGTGHSRNGSGSKGKALGHTTAPPGQGGTPPGQGGTPPGLTKPPPGQSAGRSKAQ